MSTLEKPSLRDRVRARPVLFGAIAVAAIAAVVVVLVVFQPQRLLYDNVVDDEFPVVESSPETEESTADRSTADEPAADEPAANEPTADASDDASSAAAAGGSDDAAGEDGDATAAAGSADDAVDDPPESTGPVPLVTGDFVSRSRYTVTGNATVYELEDGSRTLRLEDFESTNGPNLFVYLTAADADDPDAELDADYVDLGALRGNVGNQNYDIPADVDLDVYDTVVIWCRPFSVAFGAADLS